MGCKQWSVDTSAIEILRKQIKRLVRISILFYPTYIFTRKVQFFGAGPLDQKAGDILVSNGIVIDLFYGL
jgi:hypothetical protein